MRKRADNPIMLSAQQSSFRQKTPTKPSARKAEENIFQLAYHLPTMQQREIKTDLYIKPMHKIGTTDTDILQKTQARTETHTQTNSSTSDHT